tara:strand:+ start:8864 stop:9439 length:576 start_codon:yes stop_codon:yes gene_type:complete
LTENYSRKIELSDKSVIVVSGDKFWESNAGAIQNTKTVIENLLGKKDVRNMEIHILAYLFSDRSEFSTEMIELLEECLNRRNEIWMIVNHLYERWDDDGEYKMPVDELERLNKHENFHLYSFEKEGDNAILHAKVIVVDRSVAFIGSANITKQAMKRNYEIGLRVEGSHAESLARMVTGLAHDKEFCKEIS